MASDYVGMEVAVVVVTASIILSGILVGLGRAFGYKVIEHFGMDELIQSVVNSAIIGSLAAIIALVQAVSSTVVSQSCSQGTVIVQLSCTLGLLNSSLFGMFQALAGVLNLLGFYQTMSLNFGAFSISPFVNLASISNVLSLQLLSLNIVMILVELNRDIAVFIAQNALGLIFPVGLVLRTFFATRKVGGFLLALSIGLFVFYPTFVLIFPEPMNYVDNATALMSNFTNNSYYATVPIMDLNGDNAIATKLDILSGRCGMQQISGINVSALNITTAANYTPCQSAMLQIQNASQNGSMNYTIDFTGDLTLLTDAGKTALSQSLLYSVVAPIFSLIVTLVFVRELTSLLGSEVGLSTIASI